MALITLDNPLAWVHFRLRGGWKNTISTSTGFAVIICGLIMLSLRVDPTATSNVLHYWTQGLLGLQLAIILLFATSAIRTSLRKDITTRMIESHRLMPVPATQAIPGVIVGSTIQFICMSIITFLIGMSTAAGASISMQDWFLANMVLAIFGFSLWIAAALFSLLPAASFGVLGITVVSSLMSNGMVLLILPGLSALTSPIMGRSVFGIIERGGQWDWPYQVSAMAQLCGAGLCFLGAIRKYEREDQVAFTPVLGLILLAGWVLLCTLGIRYAHAFDTQLFGRIPRELPLRVVGALVSSMLLALVPVSSAVWLERERRLRQQLSDVALRKRAVRPHIVILASVLIILALPLGLQNHLVVRLPHAHILETALASTFFLLSSSYLLRILYRVTTRILLPMLFLIVLSWIIPLFIDWTRYIAVGDLHAQVVTWIGACSAVGMFYAIWHNLGVDFGPGIVMQACWPVLMGMLYYSSQRKRNASVRQSVA